MHTVPVIGSHWEGCWLAHHDCAVKVICQLQLETSDLRERLQAMAERVAAQAELLARRAES